MFAAPDGTHHPLIDLCSDSSEDEVAAGGPCDAFVEVGDALALAVDANDDDECEEDPVREGMWHYINILVSRSILRLCCCRCRCARVCAGSASRCTRGGRAHVQLLRMLVSEQVETCV